MANSKIPGDQKGKNDQANDTQTLVRVRARSLTGFGKYRRSGETLTPEFSGYELNGDQYKAFDADPNIEMTAALEDASAIAVLKALADGRDEEEQNPVGSDAEAEIVEGHSGFLNGR